jgi:SAM-dependent methyltransferase
VPVSTVAGYGSTVREPDAAFADPRLAVLYDVREAGRDDLPAYVAIATELPGHRVVDLGCGTGSLALLLAAQGFDVVGVDPAQASLDVARRKPGAGRVRWTHGDARALSALEAPVDLVLMTGNVAQVFVDDEDWSTTLTCVRSSLRDDGWFVFETRRPEARAWEGWDLTPTELSLPDGRQATVGRMVTSVALPLVTFRSVTRIDGEDLESVSTLRFRGREEIALDLARHGFTVTEVREAPDRPGLEMVFVAQAAGRGVR